MAFLRLDYLSSIYKNKIYQNNLVRLLINYVSTAIFRVTCSSKVKINHFCK